MTEYYLAECIINFIEQTLRDKKLSDKQKVEEIKHDLRRYHNMDRYRDEE